MVSPSKMLTLGRADASIALLSLNRIFHGIRLNLRLTTSGSRLPHFCLSFKVRACLLIDNAKVQHFLCASKFRASIWGDFQHEFAQFSRAVISWPRSRNFRASEITFRRQRASLCSRLNVTL